MRSPARRLTVLAAAAGLVAAAFAFGAPGASAYQPGDLPPDLQAFDAEFTTALAEVSGAPKDFIVLAHAGQLSPKDDCHKQKSAGERHWHWPESDDRGGPCVKQDGETTYILELDEPLREKPRAKVKPPWEACTSQWHRVLEELDGFWQLGLDERVIALMDCMRAAYPRE